MDKKVISRSVFAGVIALIIVVLGFMSMSTVPVGHTGILLTFGKVQDTPLDEGLHFKIPIAQDIVAMDNRVQKLEVATEAFSRDTQTVTAVLAVNYQVEKATTFSIYKNVGRLFEDILVIPATHEALKSVSAQYTAEELITQRQKVSNEIMDSLGAEMSQYGIKIAAFNILDFDFSPEYIKAVEDKQVAEQKQKQMAIENSTNVAKTEADAKQLVIKTQSQAEAKKVEADAEAYRLQKETQQLTPSMLQKMWVEAWDGKLPVMISEEGMTTIMDVNGLLPQMSITSEQPVEQ